MCACMHSAQVPAAAMFGFGGFGRSSSGDCPGGDEPPDPEKIAKALKHAADRSPADVAAASPPAKKGLLSRLPFMGGSESSSFSNAAAGLEAAGRAGEPFPPPPTDEFVPVPVYIQFLPNWTDTGRTAGIYIYIYPRIAGSRMEKVMDTKLRQSASDLKAYEFVRLYLEVYFRNTF